MWRFSTEAERTIASARCRAKPDLAVLVREAHCVVGVRTDDGAEPGNARDLLLGGGGKVDDDRAVVGSWVLTHPALEHVEYDFETQVPIHMNVELVSRVPVEFRTLIKVLRGHHPLTMMTVGVAVLHLHELRDDRAIGKELDLLREK